jgi:hypothetical protein
MYPQFRLLMAIISQSRILRSDFTAQNDGRTFEYGIINDRSTVNIVIGTMMEKIQAFIIILPTALFKNLPMLSREGKHYLPYVEDPL